MFRITENTNNSNWYLWGRRLLLSGQVRDEKENTLGDKNCQEEMDMEIFELEKGKSWVWKR